jgi:hypothetical protein
MNYWKCLERINTEAKIEETYGRKKGNKAGEKKE